MLKIQRLPLFFILMLAVLSSRSWAANYDIKEMTPEIQQALAGRKARFNELQTLKSQGIIGEDNQGNVKALKDSSEGPRLVSAENSDRHIIYQAIVDQNHLGPSGMPQVRSVFAEVQRDKAKSGDSVQESSGQWVTK